MENRRFRSLTNAFSKRWENHKAALALYFAWFRETKLSGLVPVLVKLQRPPPEMAIFFPTGPACSIAKTLRSRLPASMTQKDPPPQRQ